MSFPTDNEIKEMGKDNFYLLYTKQSYIQVYGSIEGFENWKNVLPTNYNTCINNAIDIFDMIVNPE